MLSFKELIPFWDIMKKPVSFVAATVSACESKIGIISYYKKITSLTNALLKKKFLTHVSI